MALKNLLHINQSLSLAIWRIAESEKTLQSLLPYDKYKPYPHFKSQNRRKEWLATRCLMQILAPSLDIRYQKNGKPELFDNCQKSKMGVSISHCDGVVACAISTNKVVGIDIEWISERPLKIAQRFMCKSELSLFTENEKAATLVWCAKEALYKLYGKPVKNYKEDINIQLVSEFRIEGCYLGTRHVLQHHINNGLVWVWVEV